ncbi:pantoate-beta-alanine ligase [Toxoplasma gondii ME49]|uniref:Pantoate--beta-alanine ligase n=6 Tax=Toxoplasma gondii TaxID=5811 RepID=S8EZ77_TOXGM|nr:pantoate-beta-alanine ligase [Toxoplasma gondii ME49]EPT27697.1 pantoate-beta-alanine ligase [Toxoplasma gondii ME49]|eukprot:XP_018636289.1 pantoate-beta-alanine ligase [Toxoplasma gondii ME49]
MDTSDLANVGPQFSVELGTRFAAKFCVQRLNWSANRKICRSSHVRVLNPRNCPRNCRNGNTRQSEERQRRLPTRTAGAALPVRARSLVNQEPNGGGPASADATSSPGRSAATSPNASLLSPSSPLAFSSRRRRISLVPTMGGLHEGHLHLIRGAACTGDEVWVTIFVNALQFHSAKDFLTYPASIDDDMKLLSQVRVDLVFIPSHSSLYPLDRRPHLIAGSEVLSTIPARGRGLEDGGGRVTSGQSDDEADAMEEADRVELSPVDRLNRGDARAREVDGDGCSHSAWSPPQRLFRMRVDFEGIEDVEGEGRRRCGFFRGIGTVVVQLFTLIRPTYAHCGFKDFQQVACLKRLICGMGLDALLLAHNTWRDSDGVAASSRNRRMAEADRQKARKSFLLLQHVGEVFRKGERRVHRLLEEARAFAEKENLLLHYTAIDRLEDGEPVVYRHSGGAVKRIETQGESAENEERRAKRRRTESDIADETPLGRPGTGSPSSYKRGGHLKGELHANGSSRSSSPADTADMILLDSGRYCLTVAVRGNPLTTVVDSVFLIPNNREDLLPPLFNTPWDHHCVEPKYACLPSFLVFSSFGFHLRPLRPSDLKLVAAAEQEDARVESQQSAKSAGVAAPETCCTRTFTWMHAGALSPTSTHDVWALGLFKRRLDTARNTVDFSSDTQVPDGNEVLIGYIWADAETPRAAAAAGGASPWRLRRGFITRARRRRTFGTHLLKAFLATLYKEKVSSSRTASREVQGDPMPAWLAPAVSECGFSLLDSTNLSSGECRLHLNLDKWFRTYVTDLRL